MTTTSLPDFDSDPEGYAKATGRAMAEAMNRFNEITDSDKSNLSYAVALDEYNEMVDAVKERADLERGLMLRVALRLARRLDESHLILKDRIAHRFVT